MIYKSNKLILLILIFTLNINSLNCKLIKSFYRNNELYMIQNSLTGCDIITFCIFDKNQSISIDGNLYDPIYKLNNVDNIENYMYRIKLKIPISNEKQIIKKEIFINSNSEEITLTDKFHCQKGSLSQIVISNISNVKYDVVTNSIIFQIQIDDNYNIVQFLNGGGGNGNPTQQSINTQNTNSNTFNKGKQTFIKSNIAIQKFQNIDRSNSIPMKDLVYPLIVNDYFKVLPIYNQQGYFKIMINCLIWKNQNSITTDAISIKLHDQLDKTSSFYINFPSLKSKLNLIIGESLNKINSRTIKTIDNNQITNLNLISIGNSLSFYPIITGGDSSTIILPVLGNLKNNCTIAILNKNKIGSRVTKYYISISDQSKNYSIRSVNEMSSFIISLESTTIKFNNNLILSSINGTIKSESLVFSKFNSNNNIIGNWYYEYPFGYQNGNSLKNYTFKIDYLLVDLLPDFKSTFYCGNLDKQIVHLKYENIDSDIISPSILKITLNTTSKSESLIVTILASDDNSGISQISIANQLFLNYPQDLIKGSKLNGTFQGVYEFNSLLFNHQQFIKVIDISGNQQVYNYDDIYNLQGDIIPLFFPEIQIQTIDSFKFKPNVLDASVSNVDVVLTISSVYIDTTWIPKFSLIYPTIGIVNATLDSIYNGYYDEESGDFIVKFTVLKNSFSGPVDFLFQYPTWDNEFLSKKFNNGQPLLVIKDTDKGDVLGPMITSIKSGGGNGINHFYNITIQDQFNGFKNGIINITSNIDPIPYTFEISKKNNIDEVGDTLIFKLEIPNTSSTINCFKSQIFEITGIKLIDNSGWSTYYQNYNHHYHNHLNHIIPPFDNINLITDNVINVKCTNNDQTHDNEPPELVKFNFEPKILEANGEILFKFKVIDNHGSISIRKGSNPIIYVFGENKKPLQFPSEIQQIVNSSCIEYKVVAVIPINYATFGLSVSIYGLIDNSFNYRGYSSIDLSLLSFPFKIQVYGSIDDSTDRINGPSIHSYDDKTFTIQGGELIVHGANLLSDFIIGYFRSLDDIYSFQLPPIKVLSNQLVFNLPPINTQSISLTIEIGDFYKYINNSLIINPIGYFQIIKPCSTNNDQLECSGNGVCKNTGCVCDSNWYGIDCSINQIASYNYIVSKTRPSSFHTIENEGVVSEISFIKIQELNLDEHIVTEYNSFNWFIENDHYSSTFSKYNATSTLYKTTISTTNEQSATIELIISKFPNYKTNFEFAGSELIINPNTIKYTISISNYNFKSPLNTLQLILNSSISSEDYINGGIDGGSSSFISCTSNSIGYTNLNQTNLSWIVLKVNNVSMMGEFIQNGVIDNRNLLLCQSVVPGSIITSENSDMISLQIAISIPNFKKTAVIDPNFLYLLGGREFDSLICNSNNNENINQLSKNNLIILIVCCFVGVILIMTFVFISVKYKWWIKYRAGYVRDLFRSK